MCYDCSSILSENVFLVRIIICIILEFIIKIELLCKRWVLFALIYSRYALYLNKTQLIDLTVFGLPFKHTHDNFKGVTQFQIYIIQILIKVSDKLSLFTNLFIIHSYNMSLAASTTSTFIKYVKTKVTTKNCIID